VNFFASEFSKELSSKEFNQKINSKKLKGCASLDVELPMLIGISI